MVLRTQQSQQHIVVSVAYCLKKKNNNGGTLHLFIPQATFFFVVARVLSLFNLPLKHVSTQATVYDSWIIVVDKRNCSLELPQVTPC
jgi:hypothetical protein